jgi:hypothetical protein
MEHSHESLNDIIFEDDENNESGNLNLQNSQNRELPQISESPEILRSNLNKHLSKTQQLRALTSFNNDEFFYPEDRLKPIDLNLIKKMKNVPNCTVLEAGLRLTVEKVKFFYCSCDPNKIHQLCEECAMKCHKTRGHQVKEQPPAFIRCYCGEKAHNVEEDGVSRKVYRPQCYFHELARHSQLNLYFQNEKRERLCLFCNEFCKVDASVANKKFVVRTREEIPYCECSHANHHSIQIIYSLMNKFSIENKNVKLHGLKQVQIVNLLIKCRETYENIYSELRDKIELEKSGISLPSNRSIIFCTKINSILYDKKIHLTNFFYSIKNFALLSKKTDGLKYFSTELLNLPPFSNQFIYSIINSDFEDSVSLWEFLNFTFKCFKNITIGYQTRIMPKFKMFDLENMSSLQRLALMSTRKSSCAEFLKLYIECDSSTNQNIIDLFITALRKVNYTRFDSIEAYDVISSIISILKFFAKYYLFSLSQMMVLCEELDKVFTHFNKIRNKPKNLVNISKINKKESHLFLKIVKILHLFIYIHNDFIILNSLNNTEKEINYQNTKFLHEKTELGRSITRINMKILHITSTLYNDTSSPSTSNSNLLTIQNKILRYGSQILNLFTNTTDSYSFSMKRNFNNSESYLQIIRGTKLKGSMQEALSFLDAHTFDIEKMYEQFLNYKFNQSSMVNQIINTIDCIFVLFKLAGNESSKFYNLECGKSSNFSVVNGETDRYVRKRHFSGLRRNETNTPGQGSGASTPVKQSKKVEDFVGQNLQNLEHLDNLEETKNLPEKDRQDLMNNIPILNNKSTNEKRNLLYRTDFLFTVVKLFKVADLDPEVDYEKIKKILNFIWFFASENPDNALLIFSDNIFNFLNSLPLSFTFKNFELYLHCIRVIANNCELSFSKKLVKKISNYFLQLPEDYEDKYVCLNYLLKIYDIVLCDLKSLNYEVTLLKMKSLMQVICTKYSIINDFMKFLMNVTEDVIYGKYHYFNVEEYEEKSGGDKGDKNNMYLNHQKNSNNNSINSQNKNQVPNHKIIFKLSETQNSHKKFTIFNSLVFNIFYLTLKITNKIFDGASQEDRNFLSKLFKREHLAFILKNKALNMNIRTEIIKFYRKTNLDIYAAWTSKESLDSYIRAFVKQIQNDDREKSNSNNSSIHTSKHRTTNKFPGEIFTFLEDLIKISDNLANKDKVNYSASHKMANPHIMNNNSNKFDKEVHDFIAFEVKHYREIMETSISSQQNMNIAVKNYFENGLLIPLALYFKKIFANVNYLKGDEFLSVYELFPFILKIRKFFFEQNLQFKFIRENSEVCVDREVNDKGELTLIERGENQNLDENNNPNVSLASLSDEEKIHVKMMEQIFSELKGYNNIPSYLVNKILLNTNTGDILKDIAKMQSRAFPAFEYTMSYQLVEYHHFSLIQRPKAINIAENFKKGSEEPDNITLLEIDQLKNSSTNCHFSKDQINLYKLAFLYQKRKGNLENEVSSLAQSLPEICLEYETTYRHLLLKFLTFSACRNQVLYKQFSLNAYFILFKLLQYHTGETQSELEKIMDDEHRLKSEEKRRVRANKETFDISQNLISEKVEKEIDPVEHTELLTHLDKTQENNNIFNNNRSMNFNNHINNQGYSPFKETEHKSFFNDIGNNNNFNNFHNSNNATNIRMNDNKLGFLYTFADCLFHKLIRIFIKDFNPSDYTFNSDYIEAYNLIKIFKFLCEEHNNFFQGSLIKKLSFNYNNYYDANVSRNFSDKINFFDLLLLALNHILMWSNWGRSDLKSEDYNIDYFYDLFSAIIELLIEIIQGNTVENLSYIRVNTKLHEEQLITESQQGKSESNHPDASQFNKTPLQVFVENINKSLLFHDGNNNPTLYAVRTQLMNFLLTILEEKNCPQDLKNYVIESLSVNKVLSSINNTMKIFFLHTTKEDKNWNSYKSRFIKKSGPGVGDRDNRSSRSDFRTQTKPHGDLVSNLSMRSGANNKQNSKDYKKLKFDDVLYNYFYNQYFYAKEGFPESSEFEFANTLYRYIKLISIPPYEFDEARNLIQKIHEIKESVIIHEMSNILNNNEGACSQGQNISTSHKSHIAHKFDLTAQKEKSFELNFLEHYFIIKFFEKITQTVEVYTKEAQNSTVIFTVMPNIHFLSEDTKKEFLKTVNRENQFTKLYDLIRNVDYFKKEIEYNSTYSNSLIYTTLKNLNYNLIQILVFIFALIINIYMFVNLKGDQRKIYGYTDGTIPPALTNQYHKFDNKTEDPYLLWERESIHNMTLVSIDQHADVYHSMTLVLIAINLFFILCYLIFKVPLYYEIEVIKYTEHHKVKREELTKWQKFKLVISDAIIGRDHINTLLFITLSGTLAVIMEKGELEMFYSFMLMSIVNINPTLKNISIAVKLKYKELLSTLMLTFILIYSYSSIGFYWFRTRFDATLDNVSKF